MDEMSDFLGRILHAVFIALVVLIALTTITNSNVAPQPGDPFFPAWLGVTQYGWQALLWVVPGAGTAAYVVLKVFAPSSGF